MSAKRIVVDASLALCYAIRTEINSERARLFFRECQNAGVRLIAPPLYESETDSTIHFKIYRGFLSLEAGRNAQVSIDLLPIRITYSRKARMRAREIAEQFSQERVYDATYAALAEFRKCELWTGDKAFYDTVKDSLRYVRYIGEYAT